MSAWLTRWARRALSFSAVAVGFLLGVSSLVGLPLVALGDALARRRLAWARAQLSVVALLGCELGGLGAAGLAWAMRPFVSAERWLLLNTRLQRAWVRALVGALRGLYGLTVTVEGAEALSDRRPVVVLSRHTSLIDTLLPVLLLDGWRLRYVLKRELLWDPCLDVVGHRLPNAFVKRSGEDTASEVRKLERLATGLGDGEGAVIFPEGTRFTPGKRARVLESLRREGDLLAVSRALKLQHLLPPRWAGSHALLSAAPDADVLILGHTGLEETQTLASLLRGDLIGRNVRVRLQRVPAADVPRDAPAFEAWLHDAWEELDRWLEPAGDRPEACAVAAGS